MKDMPQPRHETDFEHMSGNLLYAMVYYGYICRLFFSLRLMPNKTREAKLLCYLVQLTIYSLIKYYHIIIVLSKRLLHMHTSNVVYQKYCQNSEPQYFCQRQLQ